MSGCKNAKDVTRATHLSTISSNMGRPANERAAANIISPVGVRSLLTFVTDFSTFALECLPGAWERPPGLYFIFHIFDFAPFQRD